jgi:hypothetical protein
MKINDSIFTIQNPKSTIEIPATRSRQPWNLSLDLTNLNWFQSPGFRSRARRTPFQKRSVHAVREHFEAARNAAIE